MSWQAIRWRKHDDEQCRRNRVARMIYPGRNKAAIDGEFIVFLIGAEIHKPWNVKQWWPVARSMQVMQKEIGKNPEIGCLHIDNYGMLKPISVQYWRSFEHLEQFARSNTWSHLGAWRMFYQAFRDAEDVGIWHETYRVGPGQFEAIYGNTTRFGLAAAGDLVPLHDDSTSAGRMTGNQADAVPSPLDS